MTTLAEQSEYKAGYRDGMAAALIVSQTCAADPTATVDSVVELLATLASSSVIQPDPAVPDARL